MIFDYISIIIGILKMIIYRTIYFKRITIEGIAKINSNFRFNLSKNTKLKIGKGFKGRNNINIRNDKNGNVIIGSNVFLNDNVSINCQKNIVIGDNTLIGNNVIIIDHDHDYKNSMENFVSQDIHIGKNVWIGANAIILKGTVIEDNMVIAAGTVVKGIFSNNSNKKLIYNIKETKVKEV